jgi:PEP-CTERM motif-containing protein
LRRLLGASALCFLLGALSPAATLVTGTPNSSDNSTGTPTGLSPVFGTLLKFDELTPNSALNPTAYAGSGVTSITPTNGTASLAAVPFSGQSQPNYIGPLNFSNIGILITLAQPTSEIGVGLLAGSSSDFILRALGTTNNLIASYAVTVPSDGVSAFNAYYAIQDTAASIKSLEIVGNGGIDDVQFLSATASVPEPASFTLLGGGLIGMGVLSLRRRKKN